MMMDYPLLAAVAAVVREGSFERAAAALHVMSSAISQRVKLLEDRLGRVLINRGQPCTATRAGQLICRHVESVGLLELDLTQSLPSLSDGAHTPVTLRLGVNSDSVATWFLSALAAVDSVQGKAQIKNRRVKPARVLFDIVIEDQDHTEQLLRAGDVLAAVTTAREPVQGCRSEALGGLEYVATASPGFIARYFKRGITAATLAQSPCITFSQKDQLQTQWIEKAIGQTVVTPKHWIASTHAFIDAALVGLGWGMNPRQLVQRHLESGDLIDLKPDCTLVTPLYWQCARLNVPLLHDLTLAVRQQAELQLLPVTEE